jgi:predicted alpha-1,2-mannosidase
MNLAPRGFGARTAIVLCFALAIACSIRAVGSASPQFVLNPVLLVDPFIGTTATYDRQDVIDTFPGADVPFGMVQWSPDTPSQNAGGGYEYSDKKIIGFGLDHLSGPGCSVFGDFDVLPVIGAVRDPADAQQPFTHVNETAIPGYYAVTLGDPGIRAQLSVTARTGLGEFTFPASREANLLFNASSNQNGVVDASIRIVPPHEIEGSARTGQFCGMPDLYNVYFVARFDRPFTSYGTWRHQDVAPGSAQSTGAGSGGWVSFDALSDPNVKVKVGLSFVSEAGARANLQAENKGWDLGAVQTRAADAWQQLLSRIEIQGGSREQQAIFYTALYHALLHPNVISDVTGEYPGFDFKIHRVRRGHEEYGNFSGWDIYRSQAPLMALLAPSRTSDAAQSLVDEAEQGGWLPKWPLVNGYTAVMAGDAADAILAGYYAFGARDFDTRAALAAMVKGATILPGPGDPPGQGWYEERPANDEYLRHGYVFYGHTTNVAPVPNGASETLEYALADLSIAQFAHGLGDEAVYRSSLRRSQNWANVFDTATGYIAARDSQGAFLNFPITADGQPGFQEGNAAQYTWETQEDYRDLIRGMGGRKAALERLDVYFSRLNAQQDKPYAWMGNEPSIGDEFVYLAAGEPWKAQQIIREVQNTQWLDEPQGLAGNDDLGTMSAWYVWNAMGLFPENPALRRLVIGTPLFPHVFVRVPGGLAVDVAAPGAAANVAYVQSLRVGGVSTQKTWVDLPMHGTLALDFTMSATADTSWGTAPDAAPPSYALTPVVFPASTLATLAATNLDAQVSQGGSSAVAFQISNTQGEQPVSVSWIAHVPAGITLRPESGTVTVPAGGTASVAASVTAASGTAAGYYDLPITAAPSNGAVLPHVTAVVRVGTARPALAYVLNSRDGTVTPIDVRTHGFAGAILTGKGLRQGVLAPDGSRLYVLDDDGLQAIDTVSQTVRASVKLDGDLSGIAISPDGRTLWISQHGKNDVVPVDVRSLRAGTPVALPSPGRLAIAPDGSTAYVLSSDLGTVTPVDLSTRRARTPIAVGVSPSALAIAPDGKTLYVTQRAMGDVLAMDLRAGAVSATIHTGISPSSIAVAPDGTLAYVTNWAARTVTPIDLRTGAPGNAIDVGGGPTGVAFTRDGVTAFVVTNEDDAVVPIDVPGGTAGAPIPVGRSPLQIVL